MTQDEIIEMARQAELTKTIDCCGVANKFCSQDQWKGNLFIFAKLVAQHEREACWSDISIALLGSDRELTKRVFKAIRARGNQ